MQVNQDMKTYNDKRLSVLIIADLMAKREQSRWNDLTYAATPAGWYLARLLSTIYAVRKGSNWCICSQDIYSRAAMPCWRTFENQVRKLNRIKKKKSTLYHGWENFGFWTSFTFIISDAYIFCPRDEKSTATGKFMFEGLWWTSKSWSIVLHSIIFLSTKLLLRQRIEQSLQCEGSDLSLFYIFKQVRS